VDRNNADQYVALTVALAEYEKLEPPTEEAKARLVRDTTGERPLFHSFIAYCDGVPVGYLAYFFTYSTFLAKPTLFLEDIFVLDQHRGKGIGKKMFTFCVREAEKAGCGRMEWTALDWNTPAHKFYESMHGKKMPWYMFRLVAEDFSKV
jgi:GNAT superfamily N-acetyltransferase